MKKIKGANRIIIVDLLYLGDLLFATPFIRNLRREYPQARIDMIVNANFFEIMEDNPYLDNVYAYNKKWNFKESWSFAKELKANHYDLALNIHGNWRSAFLVKLIKADYTIGFGSKGRGVWLDKVVDPSVEAHMVEIYLDFLRDIGITEIDNKGLEIGVNQDAIESVEEFLQDNQLKDDDRIIGINTGGSWPTKRWTTEGFAKLADRLVEEYQAEVIFFGGPNDVARVEEIVGMMEHQPIIAAGRTSLKELAALAQRCDLFISGDSGPVHVAASVGTTTLAIFGPSDDRKYRPYGNKHQIIETGIECRPCGEHQCPLGHHNCMRKIYPEDIITKIKFEGVHRR